MLVRKMALEPAKITDFLVARALGTGTTASVYEAVHRETGQPVAIKVMGDSSAAVSEMRERFAREALLLSGVDSRHVGKILGFGFDRGQPFLVLERLNGETLDAKLRRDGPILAEIASPWVEQLIVGVRDCHDANVIHRDIKPSNIFLHRGEADDRESVRLIDFGVARLREITGDVVGLTSANHVIGSMGYMAPEQFKNAAGVGFQADLYAIGVVVFRTLTGRLPFVSKSLDAILKMKAEKDPLPVSSMVPGLQNRELDSFVRRSMEREPENRFRNARDMLDQWRRVMGSLGTAMSRERENEPTQTDDLTIRSTFELPASFTPPSIEKPRIQFGSQTLTAVTGPPPDIESGDDSGAATGRHPNLRQLVERELELERARKLKG